VKSKNFWGDGIPSLQEWRAVHDDGLYCIRSKKCNNLCQEIMPTIYSFSGGLKDNQNV